MQSIDFGVKDYALIYNQQQQLVAARMLDDIPDTLLLGEHLPVYTLGRSAKAQNWQGVADKRAQEIPMITIERGGDVTFHGPGQLIGYSILKLPGDRRDLHRYLRDLEESIILTLADFEVEGFRTPGWTGVWVYDMQGKARKIASIGVAVRHWVTYHGIALNINIDCLAFQNIQPCGLPSETMVSLCDLLGQPIEMQMVKASWVQAMKKVFGHLINS